MSGFGDSNFGTLAGIAVIVLASTLGVGGCSAFFDIGMGVRNALSRKIIINPPPAASIEDATQ